MPDPGIPIWALPEEMCAKLCLSTTQRTWHTAISSRFSSLHLSPLGAHITFPPLKNLKWDFQRKLLELDDQKLLRFQPVFVRRSQPPTVISLITVVKEENKEYCHLRSSVAFCQPGSLTIALPVGGV